MDVSYAPWWCHPVTTPGSVRTSPDHMPSIAIACSRFILGVGSASTLSAGGTCLTGSEAAMAAEHTADRSRSCPVRHSPTDEDAERVAGQIGIDAKRFHLILGPVEEQ